MKRKKDFMAFFQQPEHNLFGINRNPPNNPSDRQRPLEKDSRYPRQTNHLAGQILAAHPSP